jgi:2-oxoglutarate dehydrogenase E2 component (dihydrolipoamide succinyltransferase)
MAKVELIMPKMGESVAEATVIKWLKAVGDPIEIDESILEIATDKVDSEVPSAVEGVLIEMLYNEDDVVKVGEAIAIIETVTSSSSNVGKTSFTINDIPPSPANDIPVESSEIPIYESANESTKQAKEDSLQTKIRNTNKFYSPLVRSIAQQESIELGELDGINGSGKNGRVTKNDILIYLKTLSSKPFNPLSTPQNSSKPSSTFSPSNTPSSSNVPVMEGDEIIEMDRMRKMIANHMVMSKHVSPHVTSFVEADVTNLVLWRNSIKKEFFKNEGQKITFTPIFVDAVVKAIKDFPMINVAVDGTNIIKRKHINIGMAAALPSGNLIVPVIKDADQKKILLV